MIVIALPENFPMRRELKAIGTNIGLNPHVQSARELPDEEGTERLKPCWSIGVPRSLPENFPMRRELKVSPSLSVLLSTSLPENFPMRRELKGVVTCVIPILRYTARELPDEEGTERTRRDPPRRSDLPARELPDEEGTER